MKRLQLPVPAAGWRVEFKLADMWVGAFWKVQRPLGTRQRFDVWVCLLPMVPIHVWFYRRVAQEA